MAYKKPVAEKFYKQPWETYLIASDFSRVLEVGEALEVANCDIVAIDKDEASASGILDNTYKQVTTADADDIDVTPVTNAMLMTRVQVGTEALSPYKITFKGVSDNDNQFETDVILVIKDV